MPTGIYERKRVDCAAKGCPRTVVAHSRSGLCGFHKTQAWKRANSVRVNAHNRRYNRKRPEVMARSRATWNAAHPESRAERQATRRARKRGRFVEKVYRTKVWKRDSGICGICGLAADPQDWHLDHMTPLAVGGEHSYANTQVSHPACNLRKAASVAVQ